MSFGARALIRLGAIRHNFQIIKERSHGARMMAVIKAREFLWRIRALLHLHAGMAQEILSFDEQVWLAQLFGFSDQPHLLRDFRAFTGQSFIHLLRRRKRFHPNRRQFLNHRLNIFTSIRGWHLLSPLSSLLRALEFGLISHKK